MKMKWLALVTAAALGLTACGNKDKQASAPAPDAPAQTASGNTAGTPAPADKQAEEAKPVVSSGNFLADAAALQAAEDALKALPQFGGKPVNIFQNIHFYGGERPRIVAEIQDPNNPDNIDHYEFEDGKWSEPQPVRISGGGNMKDNVFPLAESQVCRYCENHSGFQRKSQRSKRGRCGVGSCVLLFVCADRQNQWYTSNLSTDRAEYEFEFNKDGSLKSFKKR